MRHKERHERMEKEDGARVCVCCACVCVCCEELRNVDDDLTVGRVTKKQKDE